MDGRRFVKRRKNPGHPMIRYHPFPHNLAIPLNDMSIGERKDSVLKALEFAGGRKGENRRPGVRDKLRHGNAICTKNFHSNFRKRETDSKF